MHRNARLTPAGRLLLCQRIEAGWPVAHAAAAMGMSRDRAYVWWRRYQADGLAGLEDRSSRPHHSPTQTQPARERRIVALRRRRGLGPARIAGIVGLAASTVHAVLVRHGLNRLDHLDRADPQPDPTHGDRPARRAGPRRHQEARPDPPRWRLAGPRPGRPTQPRPPQVGYAFVHSAVDAYSRLAYSEVLADEQGATAAAFWVRAAAFFAGTASPSNGSSPTTAPATAATSSPPPSATSATPSPGPTGPRPTARSNGSTAPSSPNGPTPGPGAQKANAPEH